MRHPPGTRLGSYEVLDGIGAGGMGEVYRARDTVLEREIAIKIVHPDYCHNPDSLVRLRREARMLASLNHPNVATLHELAEFDGSCGLIMELVAGETLSAILKRRGLNLDEAVRLAVQIAGALEAAHDRGIIHRDLKPANIKVTPDGAIKVLDFGLAKAAQEPADAAAPTLITDRGVVLGTAPYMSPEQTRGLEVDRRTDVWAFGCVLFEMLTGRLAFDGGSRSDIVAAILDRDPDWSSLPQDTSQSIRTLLRRCLQKDLRRRLKDIGDARIELEDAQASGGRSVAAIAPGGATPPRSSAMRAAMLLGAGAMLGALIATFAPRSTASAVAKEVRFSLALPDEERLASTELGSLAMRPDGGAVVYVSARGATTHLILRTLNDGGTRALPGTSGAVSPFFSPDGAWIGFFAEGKLKKTPAAGGPVTAICDAADGLGGSWSASGTIVFAAATGAPLQRVSSEGGAVTRATELDVSRGEFSHRWPEFLPDGDTVLFTVGTVGEWDEAEIFAQSLRTGARTPILKGGTNPRYLPSGHLAYAHARAMWLAPFDARRLTIGSAVRALEGVATSSDGAAQFAASNAGAVAYQIAPLASRRLVIVDGGTQTPLAAPPHAYVSPRVSPDGRTVLMAVSEGNEQLWSYDMTNGTLAQLTFDAANRLPIWSADGKRLTFASNRNGAFNLFSMPATTDGPNERLTTSESAQLPASWSPDGEWLAYVDQQSATGRDLWLMRRNGDRVPFATGAADESAARFSPDGRRVAYVSNESGQPEVYVREVNGGTPRRISTSGGSEPVWRRDGTTVFFRSYGKTFAAPISGGTPRVVVDQIMEPGTFDAAAYDVIGSGERFLMLMGGQPGTGSSELRMILNWQPPAIASSR